MDADVKGNSVVPFLADEDKSLVRLREMFRAAFEAKDRHGWKQAAIAAHMRARGCEGIDVPYLHKICRGERPLLTKHLTALPDAVSAVFFAALAEQHEGQIVIRPTMGPDGLRDFASGLYGLLQFFGRRPGVAARAPRARGGRGTGRLRTVAAGSR